MSSCFAVNCSTRSKQGLKLYGIPQGERNEERRKKWIQLIAQDRPGHAKLCELHFTPDQFEQNRMDGVKKLKPNAIPTIMSGSTSSNTPDVNNMCRLCACGTKYLVPVFEDKGLKINLEEMVRTHLHIKVSRDDMLPHKICTACVWKLWIFHEFSLNCKTVNTKLHNILGLKDPSETGTNEHVSTSDSIDMPAPFIKEEPLDIDDTTLSEEWMDNSNIFPHSFESLDFHVKQEIDPFEEPVMPADENCFASESLEDEIQDDITHNFANFQSMYLQNSEVDVRHDTHLESGVSSELRSVPEESDFSLSEHLSLLAENNDATFPLFDSATSDKSAKSLIYSSTHTNIETDPLLCSSSTDTATMDSLVNSTNYMDMEATMDSLDMEACPPSSVRTTSDIMSTKPSINSSTPMDIDPLAGCANSDILSAKSVINSTCKNKDSLDITPPNVYVKPLLISTEAIPVLNSVFSNKPSRESVKNVVTPIKLKIHDGIIFLANKYTPQECNNSKVINKLNFHKSSRFKYKTVQSPSFSNKNETPMHTFTKFDHLLDHSYAKAEEYPPTKKFITKRPPEAEECLLTKKFITKKPYAEAEECLLTKKFITKKPYAEAKECMLTKKFIIKKTSAEAEDYLLTQKLATKKTVCASSAKKRTLKKYMSARKKARLIKRRSSEKTQKTFNNVTSMNKKNIIDPNSPAMQPVVILRRLQLSPSDKMTDNKSPKKLSYSKTLPTLSTYLKNVKRRKRFLNTDPVLKTSGGPLTRCKRKKLLDLNINQEVSEETASSNTFSNTNFKQENIRKEPVHQQTESLDATLNIDFEPVKRKIEHMTTDPDPDPKVDQENNKQTVSLDVTQNTKLTSTDLERTGFLGFSDPDLNKDLIDQTLSLGTSKETKNIEEVVEGHDNSSNSLNLATLIEKKKSRNNDTVDPSSVIDSIEKIINRNETLLSQSSIRNPFRATFYGQMKTTL